MFSIMYIAKKKGYAQIVQINHVIIEEYFYI